MKSFISGITMLFLGFLLITKTHAQLAERSYLGPELDTIQSSVQNNIFYYIHNLSYGLGKNPIHSGSRISPDGKVLYYFSHDCRDTSTLHSQDVYYCEREGNDWSAPHPIKELNNFSHNGVHFISYDHQRILLLGDYFKNERSADGVSISYYNTDSQTWSEPLKQKVKGYKNRSFSSYYMNREETVMLLSLDNKKSIGNQDIFVSFKQKENKWTKPMNLGKTINTIGSEGTMVLSEDGRWLYFSTNGREDTIGGFDVYKSYRLLEDRWDLWSIPQNLGSPVNSVYDDLYYNGFNKDSIIYLSRNYEDHWGMTHSDIIALTKQEQKPQPCSKITVQVSSYPDYNSAKSTILLNEENKESVIVRETDSHQFTELKNNYSYTVRVEKQGYLPFEQTILTNCNFPEKMVSVNLKPIQKDISWAVENIFFAFDSDRLLSESKPALEMITNMLKSEPSLRVEISGHTDARGDDNYNLLLSQARSEAVVNYLINSGISAERLYAKGYGETKLKNHCQNEVPCSEDLHQNNRRVEFTIVEMDIPADNF